MTGNPYTKPFGLLGDIADFVYWHSARPVPEIALASSIGLMAGICGRAYNISHDGLNQYVLLLAPTGTGKSFMASGVAALMRPVVQIVPAAAQLIGPANFASKQALVKHIAQAPCFLSIFGEFGLQMQQMTRPNAPTHLAGLQEILLDLYAKSGRHGELRPSVHSDREKNTANVVAPSFSLLAEGTPETFYAGLSETLIATGLLPRFLLIEYTGKRPPLNESPTHEPSPELVQQLAQLCEHSFKQAAEPVTVELDTEAKRLAKQFNEFCDGEINKDGASEVTRHLWNRAHMKALKLASLAAIGVHPWCPVISAEQFKWSVDIEVYNVRNLLSRFEKGEVGEQDDDAARINKLREIINKYLESPSEKFRSAGFEEMHKNMIIPERFLQQRTANIAAFKNARNGATKSLREAIQQLINNGEIIKVRNHELPKYTNSHSVLYWPGEESSAHNGLIKNAMAARRRLKGIFDGAPPGDVV
ncbi:hypothetical protein Rvan_3126 [Rhodomicrobium vannielii ATCC 17100]|uniref:Uncharacterized protein n=1 Tax=Rhodomicrobium vannielii (strain ATCC 17100 / DSM 162 / LMG 4299 / NCIMB 10020 / ATH 3.1.1) TaxID=648757 RepID=E3I105_RHOVT|nr:DUF3987 domain-containing protein [Rhodomicrobium vannielii]ADP72328.1 hypothetical protein Rvan_3126 [Rhodomicrobium vannielii ATCC 17100]